MSGAYHSRYNEILTPAPHSRYSSTGGRGFTKGLSPAAMGYGLLKTEAVLYLDAEFADAGEPLARNQSVLGDRTGVSGAVIYGRKAILPGVAGNYLSVPDEAALDMGTDVELIARVSFDSMTPAVDGTIIGKYNSGANQREYRLTLQFDGTVQFAKSHDGTGVNLVLYNSTVAVSSAGYVAGEVFWIKVVFDADNGASASTATFYTAPDSPTVPSSWTQLGAVVSDANTSGLLAGSSNVEIGSITTGTLQPFKGTVRRGIIKDETGTTVLDVDLSTVNNWATSFTAASGQTVTLNTTAADGGAPSGLDAKYGSVLGSYVYDGAAVLPGIAGNYLSVPDEAALDITGDIEIVARFSMPDFSPAAEQTLIAKSDNGTSQRSWELRVRTDGNLFWVWSTAGTGASTLTKTMSVPTPFVNGQTYWVKLTMDVDNGGGSRVLSLYVEDDSPTEPTWGSPVVSYTDPGTTSIFSSTSNVQIGQLHTGSEVFAGSTYRTIMRDGIDGTTVLDVDLADVDDYATSFTATTGQTVTVNSTTSDTNDPLLLTHTGENYVYLPGAASNNLSIPDAANLDITGDIEFVTRVALTDWTPSSGQGLVDRDNGDPNRAWYWYVASTTGRPTLRWFPTGSAASSVIAAATAAPPVTDGQSLWLKATLDVDNGSGGYDAKFYYAADQEAEPSSWTQLGSTVTGGSTTSLPAVTSNVAISGNAAGVLNGRLYRNIIRNGIDGTTVVDFNAATDITDPGATSFTASTGQTVTVSRGTSGRKAALVTRPIWLFGTDDYLEVADNGLLDFGVGEDFTLLSVTRAWTTLPGNPYLGKAPSWLAGPGYWQTGDRGVGVHDGVGFTESSIGTSRVSGALVTNVGIRNQTTGELFTSMNGTLGSATADARGSVASSNPFQVGKLGASGAIDAEVLAVAVFRRVLTVDEIDMINQWYGTV